MSAASQSAVLAWHYTTGERFQLIVASGLLVPAAAGVVPPERPVVWFSLAQDFEPTALKGAVEPNGKRRTMTLQEMREHGAGLVRFGLAPHALLTGDALRRQARINRATWAALRAAGRRVGADPGFWFGSLEALALADLVVDVEEGAGRWVRVQGTPATAAPLKGGRHG